QLRSRRSSPLSAGRQDRKRYHAAGRNARHHGDHGHAPRPMGAEVPDGVKKVASSQFCSASGSALTTDYWLLLLSARLILAHVLHVLVPGLGKDVTARAVRCGHKVQI